MFRRRRGVQHSVGDTGEAFETARIIQIARHWLGSQLSPLRGGFRAARQRQYPPVWQQQGQGTPGDVAGADNQQGSHDGHFSEV